MKFTLLELALLPILFIATASMLGFTFCCVDSRSVARGNMTLQHVRRLAHVFNHDLDYLDLETPDQIHEWMAENADVLLANFCVPRTDIWGNDYICEQSSSNSGGQLQFYSLGVDGVSHSGGNDPDDLNSWQPSNAFYVNQDWQRRTLYTVALACLICPFVFQLTLVLKRRLFRRKSIATSTSDSHDITK